TNPQAYSTQATPLSNGWLTVGEMHIDWTPAAWQLGSTTVVTMVYEHSLRKDGLLIAFNDASTDWVSWSDIASELPGWNHSRAALGLPPIPPEALPPDPQHP
ncbi:MAG: hypothetical protein ACIAQU_03300, partial [Phycisphaerales bacterium JB064]